MDHRLRIQIPQVPQPVSIDRQPTLVYELHITNDGNTDLTIRELFLIQQRRDTLVHYDAAAIANHLAPLNSNSHKPGSAIPAGETYLLYIEASTTGKQFPDVVHHLRYQFGHEPVAQVTYEDLFPLSTGKPVHLSPPLRVGNWTAIYDASWKRGHRRVLYTTDGKQHIPGRFAIDFMQVDSIQFALDEDSIRSYYGYGAAVLAVADGEVASVCDSFPESLTLSAHPAYTAQQATGNYISLRIAPDRFAFYEHLQPGSITVQPGDKIKKGQVIARLGFTGQTTGPHLHFHVADQNSPLGAEGVPFVFDQFTLIGRYPDFSVFGKAPFTRVAPRQVKREMPASNTVVVFK